MAVWIAMSCILILCVPVKVLKPIYFYNPIIPDYQFHRLLQFQTCVDKALENLEGDFLMAGIVRFSTFSL